MSPSPERPDWRRMHAGQFSARAKTSQDALFLTDATDYCGTEALDGFGFGASLHGPHQPDEPAQDPLPLDR